MYKLASDSLRHDSHDRFILIAAWLDKNTQIISFRVNRLLLMPPVYGLHAEELAVRSKRKTDTLAVARFNTADIRRNQFKPLMAKPCTECQGHCKHIPNVWFTNYSGEWELM